MPKQQPIDNEPTLLPNKRKIIPSAAIDLDLTNNAPSQVIYTHYDPFPQPHPPRNRSVHRAECALLIYTQFN